MLVSVLLPVKNGSHFIVESISSIINQTFEDLELIVVDDGSTDNTVELIQSNFSHLQSIKLFTLDSSIGISKALNFAASKATGIYYARMDGDDISHPDRIRLQLEYLETNSYDLIGCDIELIDVAGNAITPIHTPPSPRIINALLKFQQPLAHPTWLMKREVFTAVSGYRDCAPAEDYDFLLRCTQLGFSLGNCPIVLLNYRLSNSSVTSKSSLKQRRAFNFIHKNKGKDTFDSAEFICAINTVSIFNMFYPLASRLQDKAALSFRKRSYGFASLYMIIASLISPIVFQFNYRIILSKMVKRFY